MALVQDAWGFKGAWGNTDDEVAEMAKDLIADRVSKTDWSLWK